ncbi:MAG: hypothetical protein ACK56F_02415 [bacterium]
MDAVAALLGTEQAVSPYTSSLNDDGSHLESADQPHWKIESLLKGPWLDTTLTWTPSETILPSFSS